MKLQPYLYFDGRCREAFELYRRVLGGEFTTMMAYGEQPGMQVPPEWNDRILHATLVTDDQELLGADAPPGSYRTPQGVEVTIALDDLDRARRIFDALAEGGAVRMALQPVFWGRGFGMLTDRFGVPWMINCS